VQFDRRRLAALGPHPEIQHFHAEREGHGEVDVALRNVLPEAFAHERHADQNQEAQCEHLQGRVPVDEVADRFGEHQHHAQCDDHGRDHDPQLVGHADGGDDRVEGEDDVEQQDLDDHRREGRMLDALGRVSVLGFEFLVHFLHALPDQEETAQQQHQVAPGNLLVHDRHREQRCRQSHDPRQAHQEQDARHERECESQLARLGLLLRRQLVRQDRDENHVINPENNLQGREREQRDPDLRVGEPFHIGATTRG
jgi:hypothetical protein